MSTNLLPRPCDAAREPATQHGPMTRAMRALPRSAAPKVLRIARLESGRVVDERVLAQRLDVTVGSDHGNLFLLSDARAPASQRLFRVDGDAYVLHLCASMRGRMVSAAETLDLAQAFAQGRTQLRVADDARGKIVVGAAAFLFQLVEAPIAQTKPQLPLSLKSGSGIDWGFTVLAAFSFLAHFAFAGAVNSDWFDPTVDEAAQTAALIEQAQARPSIAVETPPEEAGASAPGPTKAPHTTKSSAASDSHGVANASKSPGSAARPGSDGMRVDAKALDDLGLKVLGDFTSPGPAAATIFDPRHGKVDEVIDGVAAKNTGVTTTGNAPPGGDPGTAGWVPPGKTSTIPTIAAAPGVPTVVQPKDQPPPPVAPMPMPGPTAGNIEGADTVVAQNRWRFAACFNRAVGIDPTDGGVVRVVVTVGEGGVVVSAAPSSSTASSGLTSCIVSSFTQMKFKSPPDGTTGSFAVPVVLKQR